MSTAGEPTLVGHRVAIVGAGPSGLFAAQHLLAASDTVRVDVFDRLPTPFGLLRYGVAPDHTSIKSVAVALARVFDDPRARFYGLVHFGRDVTRAQLLSAYDAVIYAVGASEDLRMGVPGEESAGSSSAREFVAWYSGHPDAEPQHLDGVSTAVAIGVGNVAVDVARVLLKDPLALEDTDMPDDVLAELRRASVREVWVVGRRGPQHASFTTPELRELCALPGVQVRLEPGAFDRLDLDHLDPELFDRRTRGNLQVLREAAGREVPHPRAILHFLFWHRPTHLDSDPVATLVVERTAPGLDGRLAGTGEELRLPAQLVLRAIGYRAVRLPDVPFDEVLGVIPSVDGRVVEAESGQPCPREYVVGWIKRGPIGVIGTNKSDARDTVAQVMVDLADHQPRPHDVDPLETFAGQGLRPSSFEDWKRIELAEANRGATQGRNRTKLEAWHELLDLVQHERPGGPIPSQ